MNRTDELIATALRDIAEEASGPRPLADVAWRAGRRRRLAGIVSAASTVAAAIAIAVVLLPGHAVGTPGATVRGLAPESSSRQHQQASGRLRWPLELRQVTAVSDKPCPPHSAGLPGVSEPGLKAASECFSLRRTELTITAVRSATVRLSATADQYEVVLGLARSDASRLGALTTAIVNTRPPWPGEELAFVVNGRVVSAPVVDGPITTGSLTINCATQASAEYLLAHL
jgi:hypothetical protein